MALYKGRRQTVPGLRVEADTKEWMYTTGLMTRYFAEIDNPKYTRMMEREMYEMFAAEFDMFMARTAKKAPAEFHHVYEYSSHGYGYNNVGNPAFQLWRHRAQRAGGGLTATWDWLPAKMRNPSYKQRRMTGKSNRFHDPMASVPQEEFDKLVSRSKNRKYVFRWKAPMLEYQIKRKVLPQAPGKFLFLPGNYGSGGARNSEGTFRFAKEANPTWQQPGHTWQSFTFQWTLFWREMVPGMFDDVFGKAAAKAIQKPVVDAIRARPRSPRAIKRSTTISISAATDAEQAYRLGMEQAAIALKQNERTIKGIKDARSTFHARMGSRQWSGTEGGDWW